MLVLRIGNWGRRLGVPKEKWVGELGCSAPCPPAPQLTSTCTQLGSWQGMPLGFTPGHCMPLSGGTMPPSGVLPRYCRMCSQEEYLVPSPTPTSCKALPTALHCPVLTTPLPMPRSPAQYKPAPAGSCLVLKGYGGEKADHCVPPVSARRISITLRAMGKPFREAVQREIQE